MSNIFREIVLERNVLGGVLLSNLEPTSEEQVDAAKRRYLASGECTHEFVQDEYAYMYDIRYCAVCDKGLGTV